MEGKNVNVELVKGRYGFKHILPYFEKRKDIKIISSGSLKACPRDIKQSINPQSGDTHYIAYVSNKCS